MSVFRFLALALCFATLAAPARADQVRGAGSTFVAPLIERWQQRFRIEQTDGSDQLSVDLGVDYESVGSLAGIMRATQFGMDFGASDRPLNSADLKKLRLGQFPIVAGGIAVVVNVPGVAPGDMQLTGEVIADIFLGAIGRWNDPAIRGLNPSLKLPDEPIGIVHRSDGSGTTFNFAAFLALKSEAWKSRVGVDTSLSWPTGRGFKGNEGVAAAVQATRNSIGYVEAGLVTRLRLADVRVRNKAGNFVRPAPAALVAATANAEWSAERDFDHLLVDAPGADAYPIALTVFALMPTLVRTPGRRETFEFFTFALDKGAEDARDLGYVPLPPKLVADVKTYWRGLISSPK